jgi:hypothetical protein
MVHPTERTIEGLRKRRTLIRPSAGIERRTMAGKIVIRSVVVTIWQIAEGVSISRV